MVTYVNRNRFSLGFEGEVWHEEIESLTIALSDKCDILITKDGPDYIVAHRKMDSPGVTNWFRFDNLLMTACYVKDQLDKWHEKP